ncbi:MAG TPA: DUF2235 domain-containing protein [Vicinamibacteria bacterium]|nr:DUF2235 domain-containing protein [Vicinamibacteria bacterium]
MGAQQRLVVCLDGTWNRQDSSTNVLHHFNLVRKGEDPRSGIVQQRFYHPGVGTGLLDGVTGGGFGFGLEQNVRDAYNWLIQSYRDAEEGRPADEIYVFGFSRGAYTARSLVGFIGQCGLLRRGAPITVAQLWREYCILGRRKEERRSAWEKVFWEDEARIRPMTELVSDPWSRTPRHAAALNPSERLLVQWSRRVKITYLGIYDTVGAIGWDALAIPGLTSRIALHNNLRPTTLIQHCRHALALDEHRSSFNHTPFLAFVGHDVAETERGDPGGGAPAPAKYWARTRAMWRNKIEQRWFVGAHSNVGGGYEDNLLAQRPLRWILEGAVKQGLAVDPVADAGPVTRSDQRPRDSYAEFAWPLWTTILRAKRNYRAIGPEPLPQASARPSAGSEPAPGYSLESVHEDVDESVTQYWTSSPFPLPPNLQEYVQRKGTPIPGAAPAKHGWLSGPGAHVGLVMWASLAAAGLGAIGRVTGLPAGSLLPLACLLAVLLPLVDWSESAVDFACASGRGGPRERAFLDAVYWTRALGVVLFLLGAVRSLAALPAWGWRHDLAAARSLAGTYWPVPVLAAAAALALGWFRARGAWLALVAGPAALALAGSVLLAAGWTSCRLFPNLCRPGPSPSPFHGPSLPGQLLLLELALVCLWRAFRWTAEPMANANLGRASALQWRFTPAMVRACLESWRRRLENRWLDEDPIDGPAARRMRELLRESLWRDLLGFVPVSSLVLLFGLWFASALGGRFPAFDLVIRPGGGLAWWWLVPPLAGAACLEAASHLRFCTLHAKGRLPSAPLALLSFSMSLLKGIFLLLAGGVTVAAVLAGAWELHDALGGWSARAAVLIAASPFAVLLVVAGAHGWRAVRTSRAQG